MSELFSFGAWVRQRRRALDLTLEELAAAVGEPEAGLRVLVEALALVEQTEERFWEAEIYRLKGELLLKAEGAARSRSGIEGLSDADSPEGCFLTAIGIARWQQGRSRAPSARTRRRRRSRGQRQSP